MPDGEHMHAAQSAIVLDHIAVGASALDDGWELFGGLLGGAWAYGGHSPGFWWGQLRFSQGPKVELLTPTGGADAAFLERFLAARGPGFHHLNFLVPAIEVAASRFAEIAALNAEAANLRERLEARKLLDRAKGALQDGRGMTEAQAFRWIQKTSMDRRQTMRSVAEEILAEADQAAATAIASPDQGGQDPAEPKPAN